MLKYVLLGANTKKSEAIKERFAKRFSESVISFEIKTNVIDTFDSLQKSKTDLIVCQDRLDVMSPLVFYNLLRADTIHGQIPLILLLNEAKTKLEQKPIDIFLDSNATEVDVVRASFELLGSKLDEREDARSVEKTPQKKVASQNITGTLEILTLFDLVTMLSQGKKTGTLFVLIGENESTISFVEGELIHVGYLNLIGEPALIKTLKDSYNDKDAQFYFENQDINTINNNIKTIYRGILELQMMMAIELDNEKKLAAKT